MDVFLRGGQQHSPLKGFTEERSDLAPAVRLGVDGLDLFFGLQKLHRLGGGLLPFLLRQFLDLPCDVVALVYRQVSAVQGLLHGGGGVFVDLHDLAHGDLANANRLSQLFPRADRRERF